MKQNETGYHKGMISLHDIGDVAILHEPANDAKVFAACQSHIAAAETPSAYHRYFPT